MPSDVFFNFVKWIGNSLAFRTNQKNLHNALLIFCYAYIMQSISEAEHNELDEWVCASMKNQRLFEELTYPVFLEKSKKSIQMINDFLNPN